MKSHKAFKSRTATLDPEDAIRKPVKLAPVHKSGKERRSIYGALESDEELDEVIEYRARRESVLDYFDDGEE